MKSVLRILLFIFAIAVGGVLGYYLLADYEIIKMIGFGLSCIILGTLLHIVDKKFSD